jgi:hypothetical protein
MNVKHALMLTICTAALFLSGCFNREEEIIISENGDTRIKASFEGTVEQYPPVFGLPLRECEDCFDFNEIASTEKRLEKAIRQQIANASGQRVSPRGLLLIAKGKKAIEQFE